LGPLKQGPSGRGPKRGQKRVKKGSKKVKNRGFGPYGCTWLKEGAFWGLLGPSETGPFRGVPQSRWFWTLIAYLRTDMTGGTYLRDLKNRGFSPYGCTWLKEGAFWGLLGPSETGPFRGYPKVGGSGPCLRYLRSDDRSCHVLICLR